MNRRDFLSMGALLGAGALFGQSVPELPLAMQALSADPMERRRQYLAHLRRVIPWTTGSDPSRVNRFDKSFEQWLERTGELPPDFSTMPFDPFLPDPLVMNTPTGKAPITNRAQWTKQRQWIRSQWEDIFFGKIPPAPDNLKVQVSPARKEGTATVQDVRLEFGPDHKGFLTLEVLTPEGDGPFPVLITTHTRRRPWVNVALRRGYMCCIPAAADLIYVEKDQSDAWLDVYPDYDFSVLARWSWGVMRAVDYMSMLPNVDKKKITVAGHSRNSKLALIATALDERIAAVVPSRGNLGDSISFRHGTGIFSNESLEEITRLFPHFYHPRSRFYVGREHYLPVDVNSLLSLVAPRGLMFSQAYTEEQGNAWAVEQTYRSVKSVYKFLGAEDKLGLYQVPGPHASSPEDIEVYLDFFDGILGRAPHVPREDWVNAYTFDSWQRSSKEKVAPASFGKRAVGDFMTRRGSVQSPQDFEPRAAEIREAIQWILGKEPSGVPFPQRTALNGPAWMNGRTSEGFLGPGLDRPTGLTSTSMSFGDDLTGRLYFPTPPAEPNARGGNRGALNRFLATQHMPAVIFFHPYNYALGVGPWEGSVIKSFTARGIAVFCYDMIGSGSRALQVRRFYDRYPHWSLMGKMIADAQAAITAISPLTFIDNSKIYLMGSAVGAKVALFTAALDNRVAGVASACGFTPWRLSTPNDGTEGLRHYSHLHGLLPRLGLFVNDPTKVPVDYDEIMAAIAPRPLYVMAPAEDRYAVLENVRRAIEPVRELYRVHGKEQNLKLDTFEGFNGFQTDWERQQRAVNWVTEAVGLPIPPPPPPK